MSVPAARAEDIPGLDGLGNVVPEGYAYYEKVITPREGLSLDGAYLKWYDLYPADAEITAQQASETRAFLQARAEAGRLKLQGELGFVILHRAGAYLLLLVTTWRNTNEMWESIYVKDLSKPGGYEALTFDSDHKGTYCVWELGIVWHERHAWVRFLSSKRDAAAKQAYVADVFAGRI
jgi:hypothetical protein